MTTTTVMTNISSCCCESLGFDGTCFSSSSSEIVTKCIGYYNSTFAKCLDPAKNNDEDVSNFIGCAISSQCPDTTPVSTDSPPSLSFILPIVCVSIGILCWFIFFLKIRHKLRHTRSLRCFKELGTYLLILGLYQLFPEWILLLYITLLLIQTPWELLLRKDIEEDGKAENDGKEEHEGGQKISDLENEDYDDTEMFNLMSSFSKKYMKTKKCNRANKIPTTLDAVDIYQDVTRSMWRVLFTFSCQISLLTMYAYLILSGSPDFTKLQTTFYYILGAIVQITYNNSTNYLLIGNRRGSTEGKAYIYFWIELRSQFWDSEFPYQLWMLEFYKELYAQLRGNLPVTSSTELYAQLLTEGFVNYNNSSSRTVDENTKRNSSSSEGEFDMLDRDFIRSEKSTRRIKTPNVFEMIMRFVFSVIVNVFGRNIIILLLPWHLSQSQNTLDFVLNAVSAYFILDIDDLKEPVTYYFVPEIKEEDDWCNLACDCGECSDADTYTTVSAIEMNTEKDHNMLITEEV